MADWIGVDVAQTTDVEPERFRLGDRGRFPVPVPERLVASYAVNPETGCWEWQKALRLGYGQMWIGSRVDGTRRRMLAHRLSYEVNVGPIPEGLTLDHLCRNRRCVNPAHLEPVTLGENAMRGNCPAALQARQTHCKRGHEFTEENTLVNKGKRYCLACRRAYLEQQRQARAQARADRDGVKVSAVVRAALERYVSTPDPGAP